MTIGRNAITLARRRRRSDVGILAPNFLKESLDIGVLVSKLICRSVRKLFSTTQERVRLSQIAIFDYDCQRKCSRNDGGEYGHASLQLSMQPERSHSPTVQDPAGCFPARHNQGANSAVENCCHLGECKGQFWMICNIY